MGWETVKEFENLIEFNEVGQQVEGRYQGCRDHVSKKGKTYIVHTITKDNGIFQFFGTGMLDFLLTKVKAGELIRVTYEGKEESKESPVGYFQQYNVEVNR